ncbi:MAG TPA: RNA polymerase subunit sigma-24 [Verrucomicrobiales bacterium]|nr:RNA polymerase subunit sigma-24 [Verrucomicrobiales bacterium]
MAFPTTRWTLLAAATMNGDAAGREALAALCGRYRWPVVVYLRSRGLDQSEAEDAAQDFFLKLLESCAWRRADQVRGRFRTFLLSVLNHLMQHRVRDECRLKRGGGRVPESLDELREEGFEPEGAATPDALVFDREWALTLVMDAVAVIEAEHMQRGRSAEFEVLRGYLPGIGEMLPYEEAAARTGLSLTALKAAVHRLRTRFREVLRTAVARTVDAPHEVDEELRHLASLLMRHDVPAQPVDESGKGSG